MKNHDCSVRVYNGTYTGHMCSRNAKVERDGAWYCGIHDPEYVAKKNAERDAKWAAKWACKQKQWACADGIKALGNLLLEQVKTGIPVEQGEAEEIARKHGLIA